MISTTLAGTRVRQKMPLASEVTRLGSRIIRRLRGKKRPENLDAPHLHLLSETPFRPVFIIADHRSGTTLISELFARTHCFNYVSAYHVLNEQRLLHDHVNGLAESERQKIDRHCDDLGIASRGMDNIAAGADTALDYVAFLSSATGSGMLSDAALEDFALFCRKVQYVGERHAPVILKSCPDYRNFLYIQNRFPQAKFVFLYRDPIRLLDSQLRIFQKSQGNHLLAILSDDYRRVEKSGLFKVAKALFSTTLGVNPGFSWLVRRMRNAQTQLFQDLPQLPESQYVSIRYEDVMVDAEREISRVLNFLNLTPPQPIQLNERIHPRNLPLLPDVERARPRLEKTFRQTREFLKYTD